MHIEELLRKAIAAEAKATRRKSKDVARVWALTYAEAAVVLFERLRIESVKARTLLDVARQPVPQVERPVSGLCQLEKGPRGKPDISNPLGGNHAEEI